MHEPTLTIPDDAVAALAESPEQAVRSYECSIFKATKLAVEQFHEPGRNRARHLPIPSVRNMLPLRGRNGLHGRERNRLHQSW
jgi:hypothetical protein